MDLPEGNESPALDGALGALIEPMARENTGWGDRRIQGELLQLGPRIGAPTIRRIRKRVPRPPPPHRHADTSGRRFLPTPAATVLACDFFPVDCAVTRKGIYVFFLLAVATGYVPILGTTTTPEGRWTTPHARTLLMDLGDRAAEVRFRVCDRAGHCTTSCDAVCTTTEIEVVEDSSRRSASEQLCREIPRHGKERGHRPVSHRQ